MRLLLCAVVVAASVAGGEGFNLTELEPEYSGLEVAGNSSEADTGDMDSEDTEYNMVMAYGDEDQEGEGVDDGIRDSGRRKGDTFGSSFIKLIFKPVLCCSDRQAVHPHAAARGDGAGGRGGGAGLRGGGRPRPRHQLGVEQGGPPRQLRPQLRGEGGRQPRLLQRGEGGRGGLQVPRQVS